MKKNYGRIILLVLQGMLIGVGAILPGISGGVLCASFGIYEPMMEFLSHPIKSFKKNLALLLPVLIGAGIGFVLLAKLVEMFLAAAPVAAMFLFCGLICGTVPELAAKSTDSGAKKGWSCFILAVMFSFVLFNFLSDGVAAEIQPNFGWYVFCGAIWGLSMVVPGLSSSSVLLFMGLYQPMTQGIGNLDLTVLAPLGIGFVVTILALARLVNHLITKYTAYFSKAILGFVIASVLVIVPIPEVLNVQFIIGLFCFAAGFAISVAMDRAKAKNENE